MGKLKNETQEKRVRTIRIKKQKQREILQRVGKKNVEEGR
jgi:hypothetical protein